MFILDILNVIISLCFIFFLASVFASWGKEIISSITQKRSKNLVKILTQMLGTTKGETVPPEDAAVDLLDRFLVHPIISELSKNGKNPSHIPTRDFSLVLVDIMKSLGEQAGGKDAETAPLNIDTLKNGISQVKNVKVRQRLLTLVEAADALHVNLDQKLAAVHKNIQDWFNSMMQKATYIYKTYTQVVTFILGLIIAVSLNIDAVSLTQDLWQDSSLKTAVSDAAAEYIKTNRDGNQLTARDIMQEFKSVKVPIGWNQDSLPTTPLQVFLKIVGLLAAGFAIGRGSPFWYQILKRLLAGRNTV